MKEKFIPDTEERYSITSEGIIYSNYRYHKSGTKYYKKVQLCVTNVKNNAVVGLQYGKKSKTNLPKKMWVNILMRDIFNLKQPDENHLYFLICKDGNVCNNSLDNLEWRIKCISDINFYPQPYYNDEGDIISKCCSNCGEIKDISGFKLKTPNKEQYRHTYRNKCIICDNRVKWNNIKSDCDRLIRYRENQAKSRNSEHRKKTISIYQRKRNIIHYNNVSDIYIAHCLKVSTTDITPELREIYKKKTTLKRKLENYGKEN
jgi:hypothetical protein